MREIRFDYINWYTTLRDIFFNLWIIIIAAITGFLGVRAYFDYTYVPEYTCTTTVSISATEAGSYSFSSISKTIEATATFQEMFQSTYFLEKLADMTGEPVDGTITASQISETNLITITYICGSPVDAYTTLVAVVENYNDITDHNFENMIITTISQPVVPMAPSNPISYGNYDKLAAVVMALLVLFFVFAMSYFRDTVKNETDVNSMLDAKLFCVIYHEEKNKTLKSKLRFTHSKAPLLLTDILINYRFAETFRIAALKLDYLIKSKNIKSIMITSCGENEGKSTAAVNLALAMANLGRKTLLVDADLRKPAVYKFFKNNEIDSQHGLGDVVLGKCSINSAIIKEPATGLYVLCGKNTFGNSSEMVSTKRFDQLVESLKEQFDVIIFDTPPMSLVSDAEIIASNADASFIVVRQDVAVVPEVNDMIDMLNSSGTVVEGCIFNDVHVLPKISNQSDIGIIDNSSKSEVMN